MANNFYAIKNSESIQFLNDSNLFQEENSKIWNQSSLQNQNFYKVLPTREFKMKSKQKVNSDTLTLPPLKLKQ